MATLASPQPRVTSRHSRHMATAPRTTHTRLTLLAWASILLQCTVLVGDKLGTKRWVNEADFLQGGVEMTQLAR